MRMVEDSLDVQCHSTETEHFLHLFPIVLPQKDTFYREGLMHHVCLEIIYRQDDPSQALDFISLFERTSHKRIGLDFEVVPNVAAATKSNSSERPCFSVADVSKYASALILIASLSACVYS
jgi:hypothetical protein